MNRLDIPLAPTVFPNGGDDKKGKKEFRKAKRNERQNKRQHNREARKNYRQDNKLTKEERKERRKKIAITAGMNAAALGVIEGLYHISKKK
jgi:hypothetical protein